MSLLVDATTRLVVQGLADRDARMVMAHMVSYGTPIVAAVASSGSEGDIAGVPVYGSLDEVIGEHRPNATLIMSPPGAVLSAALDALDRGIHLLVIATAGVSRHDTAQILDHAAAAAARVLGPSTIGVVNPGAHIKIGAIGGGDPDRSFPAGRVGIITRGGMTAEIGRMIKRVGLGVSTAVSVGSEATVGTPPATLLPLFQRDQETDGVVLFGEPEALFIEEVAEVLASRRYLKPLIIVIGGQNVRAILEGDAIAQATAILTRRAERLNARQEILRELGAIVTDDPSDLPLYLSLVFKNQAYLGDGPSSAS